MISPSKYSILLLTFLLTNTFGIIPITISPGPLPAAVNNAATPYFPPILYQAGESCASVNGIAYVFTYELNAAREVSASLPQNQLSYFSTFHFLNNGNSSIGTHRMFLDAWKMAEENGIPNNVDFGTAGVDIANQETATLLYSKWMSGYDNYYNATHNRIDNIDSLSLTDSIGFLKLKQWLYDHGNGSRHGGIATVNALAWGIADAPLVYGAQKGKIIITSLGTIQTSGHAYAIVGYDDSIRYDFNKDGQFTNTIDINGDGKVTMQDWEIGAVIFANSWGKSDWDSGFVYCPYRLLCSSPDKGGIGADNHAYFISVNKNYSPKMLFKIALTDSIRNNIALSVGISSDVNTVVPAKTRTFEKQFTYAGGPLPLCGNKGSQSIEIGLDISDLWDSIAPSSEAKFFFMVDSKGGTGIVQSLSLMDYTSGTVIESKCLQQNVPVLPGKTILSITCKGLAATPLQNHSGALLHQVYFRKTSHSPEIFLSYNNIVKADFVDILGKQIASISPLQSNRWITIPATIQNRVCFLRVVKTDKNVDLVRVNGVW